MKRIIFVLNFNQGGSQELAVRQQLHQMCEQMPKTLFVSSPKKVEPNKLGSGRSFRGMVNELHKQGLNISDVDKRDDGAIVFIASPRLDAEAELLFLEMTTNTGWSVVRYDNPDDSTVFAAKAPCNLTDQVKSKEAGNRGQMIDRDWKRHTITL